MKKISITILIFLFFNLGVFAQYMQDIQGRPLLEISYTDVTGTPFLFDAWIKGTVELENGLKYKDVPLKFSAYKDELFFKDSKSDNMLAFVVPVKTFVLDIANDSKVYRNGFPDIDSFNGKSYYEVISDGTTKLLYKSYKTLLEIKPYNSATVEKRFSDNANYYVFKDGVMRKFKPSKKDVLALFSNKSTEIDTYLKSEKIDLKKNEDLKKLFEYCSSL
ncbi:hypothetical protein N9R54_02095 [Pelobium sp.]|nr:hypothetical protein [Pelobium sp.]MDA9555003.1 hypothetical protein [Pelobium sp.]